MAKFIIVAAVLAFAAGIMVGVNSTSGETSGIEQVLANATPASSDIPQLDEFDPNRMTNIERIDAEIAVLNMLESSISERNAEYEALLSEITGLKAARDILGEEIRGARLVLQQPSGQ